MEQQTNGAGCIAVCSAVCSDRYGTIRQKEGNVQKQRSRISFRVWKAKTGWDMRAWAYYFLSRKRIGVPLSL